MVSKLVESITTPPHFEKTRIFKTKKVRRTPQQGKAESLKGKLKAKRERWRPIPRCVIFSSSLLHLSPPSPPFAMSTSLDFDDDDLERALPGTPTMAEPSTSPAKAMSFSAFLDGKEEVVGSSLTEAQSAMLNDFIRKLKGEEQWGRLRHLCRNT